MNELKLKLHADNYVRTLTGEEKPQYSCKANNEKELSNWQDDFRRKIIEILGINNILKRNHSMFNQKCLNIEHLEDHIREEWTIEAEPGYQISFYILKPLELKSSRPLIITPHGHGKYGKDTYAGISHNEEDKASIIEGERDIALQAVREGYIAIALDQRGFANSRFSDDIKDDKNNSCRTMQMHALLFGRTLIGERVYDISRLIDYAKTLSFVDERRIGITGNSGGGTTALFAAAVDKRISLCIPSCYFCTFKESIGSIYHCECNYIPAIMTLGEMHDVAGLIAPRPFLAIAGINDRIFPIGAVRAAYEKLKLIYHVAGASEVCELYVGLGGHRYYKERVWGFVKEHFKD